MSAEYEGKDPMVLARQAERDLNTFQAKQGVGHHSASAAESGVDETAAQKFPGGHVTYGSAASGAGDNREIPIEEGGEVTKNGRLTKARAFEGEGGPEDKERLYEEQYPGSDAVQGNVRQQKQPQGEPVPANLGGDTQSSSRLN